MLGRFRGFTYGPGRPLYIPWSEVRAVEVLTLHLRNYPYAFYVQEQTLLDAATRYVE